MIKSLNSERAQPLHCLRRGIAVSHIFTGSYRDASGGPVVSPSVEI